MRIFAALFFAAITQAVAQRIEVPSKLEFAGIQLSLRDDAIAEIQKDVDALTASPKHYEIKAERARIYFPIIEKVFREEGLPDDFKFLVLQESALIPDAVSTSNAVGFWQFKDFTALEMGMRVDREIDERLNIVSSTRAAARYLKKNNQIFDNWLFALQSYQMGAGGVMRSEKNTHPGARRMEITGKTYWYVKKYLAHKIAFQDGVKGTAQKDIVIVENRNQNSLDKIARETGIDLEEVKALNKWAKSGKIPDDRSYVVLLPVPTVSVASDDVLIVRNENIKFDPVQAPRQTPVVASKKVNGVPTIQALPGDDARKLAARSGVDYPKFLRYNDLRKGDKLVAGQHYFLSRKRLKATENFHKIGNGETLWLISQKYGIQLKRLKRYNRIGGDSAPEGTILYLASRRPKSTESMASVADPVLVSGEETFNWGVRSETATEELIIEPISNTPKESESAEVSTLEPVLKQADSSKILPTNLSTPILEDTTLAQGPVIIVPENHIVAPGETLYGIAKKYDLAVMDLVEWNDLSLQQGIRSGQVLKLSKQAPIADPTISARDLPTNTESTLVHTVKTSDTLYSISRQYNVTIKELMEWNEKKDFSLSVGEKLRILRAQ